VSAVVAVVVLFCAVIVMVKRIDNDRGQSAILARDSSDTEANPQAQVLAGSRRHSRLKRSAPGIGRTCEPTKSSFDLILPLRAKT